MYSTSNEDWELEFNTELPHVITDAYRESRTAILELENMEGSYGF